MNPHLFKWLAAGLLSLLVCAGVWVAAWTVWQTRQHEAKVFTFELQPQTFHLSIDAPGRIESLKRTKVVTRDGMRGVITRLADEGTFVEEGDEVAYLQPEYRDVTPATQRSAIAVQEKDWELEQVRLKQQLDSLEESLKSTSDKVRAAELGLTKLHESITQHDLQDQQETVRLAEYVLDDARQRYERDRQLLAQDLITRTQFEETEAEHKEAEIALERAQVALTKLRKGPDELKQHLAESQVRTRRADAQEREKLLPKNRASAELSAAAVKADLDEDRLEVQLFLERQAEQTRRANQDGLAIPSFEIYGGGRIQLGSSLWRATTVADVVDMTQTTFVARVPEARVGLVRPGQQAQLELTSLPGKTLTGKVSRIGALGKDLSTFYRWGTEERPEETGVKIFEVFILLEDSELPLKLHETGRVLITVMKKPHMLLVPRVAVEERNHKVLVHRWTDAGPEPVAIQTGLSNEDYVEVIRGLHSGDRLLLVPPRTESAQDDTDDTVSARQEDAAAALQRGALLGVSVPHRE